MTRSTASKIISAVDAARRIRNGATMYVTGVGLGCFAEDVAIGIRDSFLATGHPRDLSLYHATGIGNGKDHFRFRGKSACSGRENFHCFAVKKSVA